mmetsp:Transcript_32358/g.104485  ORF Transcript_32358/g.104485 Transcript_32358/m.104485 type:complete len:210 (+) Transcript_32358:143-772(+)
MSASGGYGSLCGPRGTAWSWRACYGTKASPTARPVASRRRLMRVRVPQPSMPCGRRLGRRCCRQWWASSATSSTRPTRASPWRRPSTLALSACPGVSIGVRASQRTAWSIGATGCTSRRPRRARSECGTRRPGCGCTASAWCMLRTQPRTRHSTVWAVTLPRFVFRSACRTHGRRRPYRWPTGVCRGARARGRTRWTGRQAGDGKWRQY